MTTGTGMMSFYSCSNVEVHGLGFIGAGSPLTSNDAIAGKEGLVPVYCSDVWFHDLWLTNIEAEALMALADCPRTVFEDNIVIGAQACAYNFNSPPTGTEHSRIVNNYAENCQAGLLQVTAKSVVISGNQYKNSVNMGASVILLDGVGSFVCSDNIIEGVTANGAGVSMIIVMNYNGGSSGVISNNVVANCVTATDSRAAYPGLICVDFQSVYGPAAPGEIYVTGNLITGNAEPGHSPSVGISLRGDQLSLTRVSLRETRLRPVAEERTRECTYAPTYRRQTRSRSGRTISIFRRPTFFGPRLRSRRWGQLPRGGRRMYALATSPSTRA